MQRGAIPVPTEGYAIHTDVAESRFEVLNADGFIVARSERIDQSVVYRPTWVPRHAMLVVAAPSGQVVHWDHPGAWGRYSRHAVVPGGRLTAAPSWN